MPLIFYALDLSGFDESFLDFIGRGLLNYCIRWKI